MPPQFDPYDLYIKANYTSSPNESYGQGCMFTNQNIERITSINLSLMTSFQFITIKGKGTTNQTSACFVLYLIIINTFLKNDMIILKQIV